MFEMIMCKEKNPEIVIGKFMCRHPVGSFFVMFAAMPLVIVLAVAAAACVAALPIVLICSCF